MQELLGVGGAGATTIVASRGSFSTHPERTMSLPQHARAIWQAAVDSANPFELVRAAVAALPLEGAGSVLVVGGGKAGAGMAAGVEAVLGERASGLVHVPAGAERPLRNIELRAARP